MYRSHSQQAVMPNFWATFYYEQMAFFFSFENEDEKTAKKYLKVPA